MKTLRPQSTPSHGRLRTAGRALLGAGLALLALAAPAPAQGSPQLPGPGLAFQNPLVTAPQPFQWSTAAGLGLVKVQAPIDYGWIILPNDKLQFRFVPSLTGDPTIEAIFWPPASGHPTQAERVTFQFPLNTQGHPKAGALVIAFHSYGVSEKDIWINTDIAQLCAERGWALIAPYGMVDTHYGNVQSQESLTKVLNVVRKYFKFDEERVYAVGFSMGGGAALSYSMRHLSDSRVQVAAVVNHTGTQDLVDVYQSGSFAVKAMLSDEEHFGGAPVGADAAFPYLRVSPSRIVLGNNDPNNTPLRNLGHIPIYTFLNLDDPQTKLISHNQVVTSYLQGLGHPVTLVTANKGAVHNWSTLDMNAAFRWLERKRLPKEPTTMQVFADREIEYLATQVRAKQALRQARYDLTASQGTNALDVLNTRYLDTLFVDLERLGLSADVPLMVSWSSIDDLGDELVLPGYPAPPASVLRDGLADGNWSHDPITAELTLAVLPGTTAAVFDITP